MKNFVIGLVIGWTAAFWYYTQGDYVRAVAANLWARASAPGAPIANH